MQLDVWASLELGLGFFHLIRPKSATELKSRVFSLLLYHFVFSPWNHFALSFNRSINTPQGFVSAPFFPPSMFSVCVCNCIKDRSQINKVRWVEVELRVSGTTKTPADFLKPICETVVVKLIIGVDYGGDDTLFLWTYLLLCILLMLWLTLRM